MPTDSGLKDLTYSNVDGGTATPSVTTTLPPTPPNVGGITGATVDLLGLDTGNAQLPPEIALRAAMSHTVTAGTDTFSATPRLEVYALWLTAASAGTPDVGDRRSDMALVAVGTDSAQTIPTAGYKLSPTNNRIIATKGRYLRLFYVSSEVPGDIVKFGAKIAPVFDQTN